MNFYRTICERNFSKLKYFTLKNNARYSISDKLQKKRAINQHDESWFLHIKTQSWLNSSFPKMGPWSYERRKIGWNLDLEKDFLYTKMIFTFFPYQLNGHFTQHTRSRVSVTQFFYIHKYSSHDEKFDETQFRCLLTFIR